MAEINGVSPLGDGRLGSALYFYMSIFANYMLFLRATWFKAVTWETAVNGSLMRLGRLASIS